MFNEEQRRIFGQYWNGEKMVWGDPLRIHRRLHASLAGEPNKYLEQARSEDLQVQHQARERLVPAAIYALEMVPFDPATGAGALEEDVFAALRAYLEFMDAKKEREPTSQTFLPPTQVPAVGSYPQSPIMAPGSLSGAISDVPGFSNPGM